MTNTNSAVLRWAVPPETPVTKWAAMADELKAHMNEWGVIAENQKNNTLARNVKQGSYKAFQPAGMFESRSVKEADGNFTIYARFTNGEVHADTPTTRKRGTGKNTSKGTTTTTRRRSTAKPAAAEQPQEQESKAA